MLSVKVSTKHQIVVPSQARRELGIQAGDRLDVLVTDDSIVLRKRPARASDRLRGFAAGKGWYEPDPVTFVRRLREEWEEHATERAALIDRAFAERPQTDRPGQ
jgi:AbrB family looped-hinge helix DNA binding protein